MMSLKWKAMERQLSRRNKKIRAKTTTKKRKLVGCVFFEYGL